MQHGLARADDAMRLVDLYFVDAAAVAALFARFGDLGAGFGVAFAVVLQKVADGRRAARHREADVAFQERQQRGVVRHDPLLELSGAPPMCHLPLSSQYVSSTGGCGNLQKQRPVL
jgi:hypothetical protein